MPKWTEDLSVGITEIDDQHKALFASIDNLLSAMKEGKGTNEVNKSISFLGDYTVKHFSMEESNMSKYNYPSIGMHKTQHQLFIKTFTELKLEIESKGISSYSVMQVKKVLFDWLVDHIQTNDKLLGKYLQKQA